MPDGLECLFKCFVHNWSTNDVEEKQQHEREKPHKFTGTTTCGTCKKQIDLAQYAAMTIPEKENAPHPECSECEAKTIARLKEEGKI